MTKKNFLPRRQIAARRYEDVILPDKLGLSLEYLEKLSVRKDIEIIIETLKSVIRATKRRRSLIERAFRRRFCGIAWTRAVEIDLKGARRLIEGRSVLVTGAAGSIGSELCRQIVRLNPKRLVCLDHDAGGIKRLQRMMAGMSRSDCTSLCRR